ncbi:GGDEF domain-containing protein [Actinoplanes sp. NPDC049548]|uniref:GGDEF domain-containing protein n=1 Tax=Actinoplanes sp. NPDC049548 TaxID=3155152 RepID=UPI00341B7C6F
MTAPMQIMGPLYTTLHQRNLYGRHLPAALRTTLLAGVFASMAVVLAAPGGSGLLEQLPSIFMMTIILRVLAGCLHRLESTRMQLHHRANHDSLTELANRDMFTEAMFGALTEPPRSIAAIFIDLDDFKGVNDTLGHAAGDKLLKEVADRLRSSVRATDVPARIGGDEFAVLLRDVADPSDAIAVAERFLHSLQGPMDLDGPYRVTCSIGIAVTTETTQLLTPGERAERLLQHADAAMYQAKTAGKNQYRMFDPRPASGPMPTTATGDVTFAEASR